MVLQSGPTHGVHTRRETSSSVIAVNAECPDYIEGAPMLPSVIANMIWVTGKPEGEARAT